jgi:hypothetical protein
MADEGFERFERFEVVGHGVLWFDDESSIIGAASVAATASLTELRRALDRYRATMYDGEFDLIVYDVDEALLLEDETIVAPQDSSLRFAHHNTFVRITLAVDATVRFNRFELAEVLLPQLQRHRALMVELTEEILPLANVARLTVEISPRGRTVGEALQIGDDLRALWEASVGGSMTPRTMADLLRAERPELLVGQPETVWFEAKGRAYDLKTDRDAIELAKDVSALANRAEGGLLVLGVATTKRAGVDTVKAVRPLPMRSVDPRRHQQSLDKWIFPRPQDLVIEAITVAPDRAVMFILVPPQPDALLPFLVTGAIREGRIIGNHFSLVRRRGDETAFTQAEAVHGLMVAGRAALAIAAQRSGPDALEDDAQGPHDAKGPRRQGPHNANLPSCLPSAE